MDIGNKYFCEAGQIYYEFSNLRTFLNLRVFSYLEWFVPKELRDILRYLFFITNDVVLILRRVPFLSLTEKIKGLFSFFSISNTKRRHTN